MYSWGGGGGGVRLTWFDCKSVLGRRHVTRRKLLVAREKKPLVPRVSNGLNSLNNGAMGGGEGRGGRLYTGYAMGY